MTSQQPEQHPEVERLSQQYVAVLAQRSALNQRRKEHSPRWVSLTDQLERLTERIAEAQRHVDQ